MNSLLLRGFQVVDPQSPYHLQHINVLIESGIITAISPVDSPEPRADKIISYPNAKVSPGWFDMGVQLADPGYEWKEDLTSLAQAAQAGGFTDILCYPLTLPVLDHAELLYGIQARSQGLPARLHLCGAATINNNGIELAELYDMSQAGARAFSDGTHSISNTSVMLRALQYLRSFGGLLLHYPSDPYLSEGGQMNEGAHSTLLGMKGIPVLAEEIAVARDLDLIRYTEGRIHFQPMSTPEAIRRIAKAREKSPQLSIGVAAYSLCLDDGLLQSFDTFYKTYPPIRNNKQVQALKEALQQGQIDTICSQHSAQGIEEKKVEFYQAEMGMLGLQTLFPLVNEKLIASDIISLSKYIELISINPRKVLGLTPNSIRSGEQANLTLFNPDYRWTLTPEMIPSRAKNSPFLGKHLQGGIIGTYHQENYYENPYYSV